MYYLKSEGDSLINRPWDLLKKKKKNQSREGFIDLHIINWFCR